MAKIRNIQPYYIVVKQNQQIVLQLYVQVLKCTSEYLSEQSKSCTLNVFGKLALRCSNIQLLVIGHLFRHDGKYIYIADTVKDKQHLFVETIKEVQQKIKHQALFLKDLPEELILPYRTNTRFLSFSNDISMQLKIPNAWQNMDDYHKALSKKYAKRMLTTQKHFEQVVIKELTEEEVEKQQEEIYKLYLQVAKNQTISLGLLNQNYFPIFKKTMGNNLKMYGYYYQEKLIAFTSAILHDGAYDMNYIGFDYAHNQALSLYFNMLFCCVKNAIETRSHTLILGRTALEAKAILGCTPVPINGFYKVNNFIFNYLTKQITNRTAKEQGNMWMQRHPFKEEINSGN